MRELPTCRWRGKAADQASESWAYVYDDLDRLTTATNQGDALLSETFAYDRIGNMLSSKAGTYEYPAPGSPRRGGFRLSRKGGKPAVSAEGLH